MNLMDNNVVEGTTVVPAILGVASRRVPGYEYHYDFLIDDEIVNLYEAKYQRGKKTYLFEIRTSFVLNTIESEDCIMDSERFNAEVSGNSARGLMWMVEYRLAEYWMSNDEISIFVKEAMDFAIRTAEEPEHASRWLIPIAVNLNVCTVQQEWEPIDSVMERAVREEKLVPYVIWPRVVGRKQFDTDVLYYLLCLMTGRLEIGEVNQGKIRVEDVEDGMTIMPLCDICLRGPMLGTHISVLPGCYHAFHSHCIARRVLGKKYLCPTCQVPAYPYLQRLAKQPENEAVEKGVVPMQDV